MSEAIDYTARELLSDGGQIEIRALRREDETDMLAAIGKTSAQSLKRRFFVRKRHFSDKELTFFLDVDFKNHVAIVALADEAGRKVIVGGGRYVVFEPGRSQQGVGRLVLCVGAGGRRVGICRDRSMAGRRRRLDPDASSRQDRQRCRIERPAGRSLAGKRRDDKSIQKIRLQPGLTPGSPDTASGTEARIKTTFSVAPPHAFGVEISRER